MSHFSVSALQESHWGLSSLRAGKGLPGSQHQLPRTGWVQRHLPNSRCFHHGTMGAPSPASSSSSKLFAWSSIRDRDPGRAGINSIFHPDLPRMLREPAERGPGHPREHSGPPGIYPVLTRDAENPDQASPPPARIWPRDETTCGCDCLLRSRCRETLASRGY